MVLLAAQRRHCRSERATHGGGGGGVEYNTACILCEKPRITLAYLTLNVAHNPVKCNIMIIIHD